MSQTPDCPAVKLARAHVEAWARKDFDTARNGLAPNVTVTNVEYEPGYTPWRPCRCRRLHDPQRPAMPVRRQRQDRSRASHLLHDPGLNPARPGKEPD